IIFNNRYTCTYTKIAATAAKKAYGIPGVYQNTPQHQQRGKRVGLCPTPACFFQNISKTFKYFHFDTYFNYKNPRFFYMLSHDFSAFHQTKMYIIENAIVMIKKLMILISNAFK